MFKSLLVFFVSAFAISATAAITTQNLTPKNNETWMTLKITGANKADIIFVIDDSGSMSTHQQNLAANTSAIFTNTKSYSDFNTAVINTSTSYGPNVGGVFMGPVLNSMQPDFANLIAGQMNVGVNGDAYEKPFDTLSMALSEPNLSTTNAGFLRPNADLVVVFLTDTQDQSTIATTDLYNQLKALKPNTGITSLAGMITDPNVCMGESYELEGMPTKLQDFVALTNGQIFDLCGNFAQNIADAVSTLSAFAPEITLAMLPGTSISAKSIQVTVNGKAIPKGDLHNGWVYDSKLSQVILGKDLMQALIGSDIIEVSYQLL